MQLGVCRYTVGMWRSRFIKSRGCITSIDPEESSPETKRADFLLGQIYYFTENRQKMRYDEYRAQRLPIGSGTIESACKNVIAGRMKRGGMTWSPIGADGMVQIRCSLTSHRFEADFKEILAPAA